MKSALTVVADDDVKTPFLGSPKEEVNQQEFEATSPNKEGAQWFTKKKEINLFPEKREPRVKGSIMDCIDEFKNARLRLLEKQVDFEKTIDQKNN